MRLNGKSRLIVGFVLCSAAWAEFRPMYHVVTEVNLPIASSVADLNSDGYADVLVASEEDDVVGWCANDGSGRYGPLEVIASELEGVHAVCTGDLDGDSDLDVLSLTVRPQRYRDAPSSTIRWHANEGVRRFSTPQTILTEAWEIQSVHASDVDGDSDADVLFCAFVPASFCDPRADANCVHASPSKTVIGWYANDGAGRFELQATITLEDIELQGVHLTDLDGDDSVDLLAVMDEYEIVWFRNDGHGQFGAHEVISISTVEVNRVGTADLNNDGTLDVLAAFDARWDHPCIAWYANDGSARFGPIQEIPVGIDLPNGANAIHAIDVDSDGDLDVAVVHYRCAHVCFYTMAWYANDGTGQFSFQQIIGQEAWGHGLLSTLSAADLDNDEDLDIVAVNVRENEVRWFENGGLGYGPQVVISREMERPSGVSATDLDGDGDLDVLATGSSKASIAWWENRGARQFGPQQVILELPPGWTRDVIDRRGVCPADLDRDGDMDVVSTFRESTGHYRIFWHENKGSEGFGLHPVSAPEDWAARSVLAVDLDGDDDLDVLGAWGIIFWYANDGSAQFGPMQVIAPGGTENLLAFDVDGDGDVDVVSTLNWYENDGTGQFGPGRVISADTDWVNDVHAADLDGDGDMDMLSTASERFWRGENTVCYVGWYANDSFGQFGPMQLVSSDIWAVRSIDTADLDGDGSVDILVASSHEDNVSWFRNDGTGRFDAHQVVFDRAAGACCVCAVDMDGDGDMDILSASSDDDTIALYDNE